MKTKTITIILFFLSLSIFAQKLDKAKIKTLKIAHITEQMNLTEKEAEKFWPLYNANEEAEDKLRDYSSERRKEKEVENLTEKEAKAILLDMLEVEKKKQDLHSKFTNELLAVLPAKKILALYQADRSFRRKMIEQYRERMENPKDRN